MTEVQDNVMTVKEVAAFLRVSELTVHRLKDAGKLPFFKVGRYIRFNRSDVEAYTQQHATPKVAGRD